MSVANTLTPLLSLRTPVLQLGVMDQLNDGSEHFRSVLKVVLLASSMTSFQPSAGAGEPFRAATLYCPMDGSVGGLSQRQVQCSLARMQPSSTAGQRRAQCR